MTRDDAIRKVMAALDNALAFRTAENSMFAHRLVTALEMLDLIKLDPPTRYSSGDSFTEEAVRRCLKPYIGSQP